MNVKKINKLVAETLGHQLSVESIKDVFKKIDFSKTFNGNVSILTSENRKLCFNFIVFLEDAIDNNNYLAEELIVSNNNIVEQLKYLGQYSNPEYLIKKILDSWYVFNSLYNTSVRYLELIRDVMKYQDSFHLSNQYVYMHVKHALENYLENDIKNSKDIDLEYIDSLLLDIFKYTWYGKERPGFVNQFPMFEIYNLLECANSDETKRKLVMDCLKHLLNNNPSIKNRGSFSLNKIFSYIKNLEERVLLAKEIAEYDEESGLHLTEDTLRFASSILADIPINNKIEDIDNLVNAIKMILDDNVLKSSLQEEADALLCKVLRSTLNDSLLIYSFEKMLNDPILSNYCSYEVYRVFLNNINDERSMINYIIKFRNDGILSYSDGDMVVDLVETISRNTSLFLEYDLMKELYYFTDGIRCSIMHLCIGGADRLVNIDEESKIINEFGLETLLTRYKTIGFISNETLNFVYNIAIKYNRNITIEEIENTIANNKNARDIIEKFTLSRNKDSFSKYTQTFEALYPKTRLTHLPNVIAFVNLPLSLISKFNLKTWEKLEHLPLFNENNEMMRALIDIIQVFGLFENDSDVENRVNQIVKLFSNYYEPLFGHEVGYLSLLFSDYDDNWIGDRFERVTLKKYQLRFGVSIPESLQRYLTRNLTSKQMDRLRKETGNLGSEINKFLSPYSHTSSGWVLKHGVNISNYSGYLKPTMTDEEYTNVLFSDMTPPEVISFLCPYEVNKEDGFRLRKDLSKEEFDKMVKLIIKSKFPTHYNIESVHRMFGRLFDDNYQPDFFKFFMEHQDQIMASPENQSNLGRIYKSFTKIKNYYASRGNYNPSFNDMLLFLENVCYAPEFGNEEFARDVKNNDVSEEGYYFYETLLKETRNRHLTTIPRHEKTYEYVDSDGKKYYVIGKVLRSDDPFNLLVGETNFTNCCQRFEHEGHNCMEHAASSQNGGIFATYLIIDGVPTMLTQSWVWSNETKLCFDNIEATSLITGANGRRKKLLQNIATFAIRKSAEEMIDTSKEAVDKYIETAKVKINTSDMSEEQKARELEKLEEVRKRQTLSIVTVGEGYDDLRVNESFPDIEKKEDSYGPKGYNGYRDSTGEKDKKQHIIAKSNQETLPVSDDYEDIPIYRDERRVILQSGEDIDSFTLRKITDIESTAHKKGMVLYTDEDSFTITSPDRLADLYNCDVDDLRVISGEDWYYVYSNSDSRIEVFDLARREPRLHDEGTLQNVELVKGFERILYDSIELDKDGNILSVKPIVAVLREDTSYLLFLRYIRRGMIEQLGDEYAFPFGDEGSKKMVTKQMQDDIFARFREVKENGNPSMIMHSVKFRPTAKEIAKLISKSREDSIIEGRTK